MGKSTESSIVMIVYFILLQTSLKALFVNLPLNPDDPPYYTKLHISVFKRSCNIVTL